MEFIKVVFDKKENEQKIEKVNDYLKIKSKQKYNITKSLFIIEENAAKINIFEPNFVKKNKKSA